MSRRFLVALVVAGLVGAALLYWVVSIGWSMQQRSSDTRALLLELRSLSEVVERIGPDADSTRAAVDEFAAIRPRYTALRVVAGRRLEASTAAADSGDNAAPRRLQRDEKPLFDLAQALRAVIETNRDGSGPRREEIDLQAAADGSLAVAIPVEADGALIGIVHAEAGPGAAKGRPPLLPVVLAVVVPALLLLAAARFIGDRRGALAVVTLLLLVAGLGGYAWHAWGALAAADARAADTLSATASTAQGFATTVLRAAGQEVVDPPLQPASWDGDLYRQPRGLLRGDGSVDQAVLDQETAASASRFRRAATLALVLAGGICLFFGLGAAARLRDTVSRHRVAYAYVTPAMVGMILLVMFPFIYGIILSFTNQSIYTSDKMPWEIWVGVENYVDILTDFDFVTSTDDGLAYNYNNFYWTLGFTIVWTVTNVTIGVSVGMFLALLLNTRGLRFKPIYRVLLILPWAVPNYITALIWRGMFHQQFGVVNQILQMFGAEPVAWFETPLSAFVTVIATNGWLSFPFMMVICLGALQSIPADLYEAAKVDGATRWQQFRAITLPSLKPALVPAVILSVVWTFNMFNIIYLVSAGEPAGATEILITHAYKIAFEEYRYGYAAAYSTVIFAILLMYGVWQNKVTKATEGI